jgi:hypothetical protein
MEVVMDIRYRASFTDDQHKTLSVPEKQCDLSPRLQEWRQSAKAQHGDVGTTEISSLYRGSQCQL